MWGGVALGECGVWGKAPIVKVFWGWQFFKNAKVLMF